MKLKILFISLTILFLIGCQKVELPSSDFCETDSDCTVKNIGNCCGYYPACVNVNHKPDLKAVQKECEEQNMAGICGFPDISECKCENNKCKEV